MSYIKNKVGLISGSVLFSSFYIIIEIGKVLNYEEFSRIISIFLLYCAVIFFCIYVFVNKKVEIIGKKGKLRRVASAETVKKVETAVRYVFFLFAIFFFYIAIIPFGQDLYNRTPYVIVQATVKDISKPLYGMGFIRSGIMLENEENKDDWLEIYFSLEPLHRGKTYEFVVMPTSRSILSFKEIE